MLFDESAVGQLKDERSIQRVKLPIEGIEGLLVAKSGGLDAPSRQLIFGSRLRSLRMKRLTASYEPP